MGCADVVTSGDGAVGVEPLKSPGVGLGAKDPSFSSFRCDGEGVELLSLCCGAFASVDTYERIGVGAIELANSPDPLGVPLSGDRSEPAIGWDVGMEGE